VAVIGVADPKWGEMVGAIVVPCAGAQPTTEAIVAHDVTLIASYKKPPTSSSSTRCRCSSSGSCPERGGM
jgi:hypothetical protein